MTTYLDELLAEQWQTHGTDQIEAGDRPIADFSVSSASRAAVAVLGKRALALVLKLSEETRECPVCHACCLRCAGDDVEEHKPDCEWGRIAAAAKAIG